MPSSFEERYAKLNKEQKEAVDTLEGPVMVVAGPGTGKTEVLTMRVANILKQEKAVPEKILALTFTESGVVSMRRRLVELVGQDAYRVEISTFHGFANRIIRNYPDHFPNIIGAVSIVEIDQVSIMREIIDTLPGLKDLRPFGERYHYLKNILHAIEELKRQGITPEKFSEIVVAAKKEFYENPDLINASGKFEGKMKTKYLSPAKHVERNLELADVYAAYQKSLAANKFYDYSDMIMQVAQALEKNEDLLRELQDAYDYFLVDEHQDTNDAQNKIVELIADRGSGIANRVSTVKVPKRLYPIPDTRYPNLFVVGDEKQAIFRFQGASLENFNHFKKLYSDVKLISLRNNYRSTQAILNAAEQVSPRDAELTAKAGHAEVPAHLVVLSSPDVEYYFIAQKIKELLKAKTAAEEIAVLYRDNRDVAPLARMLEREKIAFTIESDQDVLSDDEIKKLMRILRAVQKFGNDVALAEALHVDFLGIPPIDVYKLSSFAAKKRIKLYEVLRSEVLLREAGIESVAACQKFFANLSAWKRAAKNAGAGEAFSAIVYGSGFIEAILNNPSATEKIAKLHALFDLLKSFIERKKNYTLDDFFTYLDLMEEHGVAVKSKDMVRLPGRVRLMTAHRSKGLEFDVVFIMNAVDKKWGSRFHRESIRLPRAIYRDMGQVTSDKEDDIDDDADERNVFYVALTRARKELFVSLSKMDREGKEQLPTQFIAELKEDLLEPYPVEAYERAFAAHRTEIEFAPIAARTPELKDKEFLNALFAAQGISVTALNNYLKCPWQYFYRNLVRIPEAPNKHLSFGNAIHGALKSYFDAFAEGEEQGKHYLVQRFEEELAHEPIPEDEYEEALAKGRKALPAFYDEYHADWSPRALNEARIAEITVADGTLVNGKLDRVEFLDNDQVRVIDYKTGRAKTRNEVEGKTKDADGDYKRQLVFYKLLLDKEGKHTMSDGVIQFIEPDERGKFHREEFSIAPAEVNELEQQIIAVAAEIKNLTFWDKPCTDPDCRYCELRKGMK